MANKQAQSKRSTVNPIETGSSSDKGYLANEVKKTQQTIRTQLDPLKDDFISQLLGLESTDAPKSSMKGEMKAGQSVDLRMFKLEASGPKSKNLSEKPERRPDILGGIDYRSEILRGTEQLSRGEAKELQEQVKQILDELQKLIKSSATLEAQFMAISVEDVPEKVGTYHVQFFTWLLSWVRDLRRKTEDAGAWLQALKSKRSNKRYGSMAKKHGTSFTLSNERTAATQTG